MAVNVNGVISHLEHLVEAEVDEAAIVVDPNLNEMLDSIRATYPLPYKCQASRCSQTVAYWALHTQGARIAPGPERVEHKANQAGIHLSEGQYRPGDEPQYEEVIVGGVVALRFPELDFQHRFEEPIEWAMSGKGNITLETNPTVGSPWPLRWGFRCPRCGKPRKHKNSQMLQMLLNALDDGQTAIHRSRI